MKRSSSAPGITTRPCDCSSSPSPTLASGANGRIAVSKRSTTRASRSSSGTVRRAAARARHAIARDRSAPVCVGSANLRARGVTPVEPRPQPGRWVQGFLRWMRVDRGVVQSTLTSYGSDVGDLVRVLGDDPRTYTARGLRDFAEQRCRHYRPNFSDGPCRCAHVRAVPRGRGPVPSLGSSMR